jgi:putative iron-dependent peroxidase
VSGQPQPGLFIEETASHFHLEFSLLPQASPASVLAALESARQAATSMRGPNVVWGFNPDRWREWSSGDIPDVVVPFEGVTGEAGTGAPVTQSDVWFWGHGNAYEKVWRAAYDVVAALASVARLDTQLPAYVGQDDRDPIGFIDGTENPALDEALAISVVPEGEPGAGGVPVLVQKWIHDLSAFEDLSLGEQESVIGRTKADSVQLDDAVMPPTSHVSRNTILDEAGEERHIFRRNTPFADLTEVGTLFIGCAAEPDRIDEMLDRMFGATDDGLTDHLVRFSTPVTGSYYFAPAMDDLTRVLGPLDPDDSEDAGDTADPADTENPAGSPSVSRPQSGLGIGSLRESADGSFPKVDSD